jgi:hypothetical protein
LRHSLPAGASTLAADPQIVGLYVTALAA